MGREGQVIWGRGRGGEGVVKNVSIYHCICVGDVAVEVTGWITAWFVFICIFIASTYLTAGKLNEMYVRSEDLMHTSRP